MLLIILSIMCKFILPSYSLYFENGLAINSINDIRIPGNTGSKISFGEGNINTPKNYFFRLNLNYTFKERHNFLLLYAPLSFNASGSINEDLSFNDETFLSGSDLKIFYKFNSYRLTYRYDFYKTEKLNMGLGLTAKIRDAKIRFSNQTLSSTKSNIGLVPLINFDLEYFFLDKTFFIFNFDALAAPQGRAEDVLLSLAYKLQDNLRINFGYRILEGGASNDEVYTFALIHYFLLGLEYTF